MQPRCRYVQPTCQSIGRKPQGLYELFPQNLTGMNRTQTIFNDGTPHSVITNHFNIFYTDACPVKAQPLWVIDTDAVLTIPFTTQCFEPVSWR